MTILCDDARLVAIIILGLTLIDGRATGVCQETQELGYAHSLQVRGEYYRAISEYDRHLYLYASCLQDSVSDYLQIARCYYLGGDDTGLQTLKKTIPRTVASHPSLEYQLNTYIGLRHLSNRTPRISLGWFERTAFDVRSRLLIGVAHLYLFDWDAAKKVFLACGIDTNEAIGGVANDFLETSQRCEQAKLKSPTIASALSIVPGLGYAYAGKYQSAISALIINALLFGASYEFFHDDLHVAGTGALLVGFGFYFGQLYGSGETVARQNAHTRYEMVDCTLERHRSVFEEPTLRHLE